MLIRVVQVSNNFGNRRKSIKLSSVLAIGTVCCALVITTSASMAQGNKEKQPRERGQGKLVLPLDTNGDGKISASEIAEEHKRLVSAADIDADGKFSVNEFKRRGQWFQALGATTLFDLMDINGDQTLTLEEIQTMAMTRSRRANFRNAGCIGVTATSVQPGSTTRRLDAGNLAEDSAIVGRSALVAATDDRLVFLAARGEQAAWAAIVERHLYFVDWLCLVCAPRSRGSGGCRLGDAHACSTRLARGGPRRPACGRGSIGSQPISVSTRSASSGA